MFVLEKGLPTESSGEKRSFSKLSSTDLSAHLVLPPEEAPENMPHLWIEGPLGPEGDMNPTLNKPIPLVLAIPALNSILGGAVEHPAFPPLVITRMKEVKRGNAAQQIRVVRSLVFLALCWQQRSVVF